VIHELKTDPKVFDQVSNKTKTFELRKSDRPFKVWDTLHLRRTELTGEAMSKGEPLVYSGPSIAARIVGILNGPIYGLAEGWCILSIVMLEQDVRPIDPLRLAQYEIND
jgi:hypothetical protein